MINDKLVILGYPRSGTKLLADAFVQNGYHNFGEFFNTYSSFVIPASVPYAKRMGKTQQSLLHSMRETNPQAVYDIHAKDMKERLERFKPHHNLASSIVTVWPETFLLAPNLKLYLENRFYLCTYRRNKYEQFLSRLVTLYNFNYDAEMYSQSVLVDMSVVDSQFTIFMRTERMQNDIVNSGRGMFIDFDELIAGKADLGFSYEVTSKDQHEDVSQYIQNLHEVKERIKSLQNFMVLE